MPTYQYRCKDCGHDLEVVQAFTDDALTECPECQGTLKKVYGNVGISFKGSGFYKNDARKSSSSSKSSTSTSSDSSSTSSSDSSSDSSTKSDTTSEKKSETKKSDTKTSSTSSSSSSD